MSARAFLFAALGAAISLAGCGGHTGTVPSSVSSMAVRPRSVSPAFVKPAPMIVTAPLPSSAMRSPSDRHVDSVGRNWTQLPGSASQVAAGYDGSLWVLSQDTGSVDKHIWHYVNNTWINVPGLAAQIAIDPTNNTLWAINSGGGIWHFNNGTWTSPGGGARSIGVDATGNTVYVVSNGGGGPDYALWENSGGSWRQIGGAGTAVFGNPDSNQYTLASGSVGLPGTYILNSSGQIWYENTNATFSFTNFPGAASDIAATTSSGIFVLSYPASASGNGIYYYNFYMPGWVQESGAATNISTDGISLYAVGGSGAIYQTAAQGLFFAGGTESASFTSSGGTYTFPKSGSYNNVSVTMAWGANNASGTLPVTVNWGYGADLPSPFVSLSSTIGTPLVYMDLLPGGTGKISFTQTPSLSVTTATSFPGTKCGFAFWGNAGSSGNSAPAWTPMTAVGLSELTVSGNSFTIPPASLPPGNTVDIHAGQDMFFALYCH